MILDNRFKDRDADSCETAYQITNQLDQVKLPMNQYDQNHASHKTYQLWINYFDMNEILLCIQNKLPCATASMAEYIAAADHVKHIKIVVC